MVVVSPRGGDRWEIASGRSTSESESGRCQGVAPRVWGSEVDPTTVGPTAIEYGLCQSQIVRKIRKRIFEKKQVELRPRTFKSAACAADSELVAP